MNPANILIIDDDTMLGEQLRSLILVLGHSATFCNDARKAFALLEQSGYDAVFCDYWMPSPSGHNFYQELRAHLPQVAPPIVLLTGGVLGDETQFFIRSTGSLQLLKPYRLPALKQVLGLALQQPLPA